MTLDLSPLDRALAQLRTFHDLSLQPQDRPVMAEALRMAAIQAFEFTYELSIKMLRRFLEMTEPDPSALDTATFQSLIRLGSERGLLLSDLPVWMDFRRARGTTSHAYDEAKAAQVHGAIPAFLAEALFLRDALRARAAGL